MTEYAGYDRQYAYYRELVEQALADCLPQENCLQQRVEDAMRYSLLGGGKRLRGVLVLAFCQLGGGNTTDALPLACAIEMVHAYSLIHDDLPCMDDDDLRRGKPTCHLQYDEATAVLAGDALLTKAFEVVCRPGQLSADCRARAALLLATAAGSRGMIGGQMIDIEHEGGDCTAQLLDTLHSLKTGALIRGAAALGCLGAGAGDSFTHGADQFAALLGLLFQIVDDILDVTSSVEELGKPTGSDSENSKITYTTLYGIDKSKLIAASLTLQAKAALAAIGGDHRFLCDLTDRMAVRTN